MLASNKLTLPAHIGRWNAPFHFNPPWFACSFVKALLYSKFKILAIKHLVSDQYELVSGKCLPIQFYFNKHTKVSEIRQNLPSPNIPAVMRSTYSWYTVLCSHLSLCIWHTQYIWSAWTKAVTLRKHVHFFVQICELPIKRVETAHLSISHLFITLFSHNFPKLTLMYKITHKSTILDIQTSRHKFLVKKCVQIMEVRVHK
jgi:hypothetical protein